MTADPSSELSNQVIFETSAMFIAEADQVAAELGVSIDVLARSAFEAYLDGVREARLSDSDEADL